MSIAAKEQYVIDNPQLEQVILEAPPIGDSVRLGIKKPPSDFQKHVLGRMAASIPQNNILKHSKFGIPKEF